MKIGQINGRLSSLEERVTRHENFVGLKLDSMSEKMSGLCDKVSAAHGALKLLSAIAAAGGLATLANFAQRVFGH